MTIILIGLGLLLIGMLSLGLRNMEFMLEIAIVFAIVVVVFCVLTYIASRSRMTGAQKRAIQEAAAKDEENKRINEERRKQAIAKVEKENKEMVASCKKRLPELEKERQNHWMNLDAMDVLSSQDMNLETVDYLINQLESHRANSITEALHRYDAKKDQEERDRKQREKEWMQYENERLQRQLDQQLAAQRYAEEVNRQIDHNWEMQRLAQKQLKETERIRRDQEYYQRYGKSINEL